jgi:hypothetical protein
MVSIGRSSYIELSFTGPSRFFEAVEGLRIIASEWITFAWTGRAP